MILSSGHVLMRTSLNYYSKCDLWTLDPMAEFLKQLHLN